MAALLVSTSWDIGDSGTGKLVSEFKKKTLQTAELSEIHCTVLSVEVEEHQREDAARFGVKLIPGKKDPWSDEKPKLTWLQYSQVHYPQLEKLTNIQHVIYGTGTKNAASAIQARLFPEAKLHLLPSPDQPAAALFVYDAWNKDDYGLTGFHRNVVQEFCERKAKTGDSVKAYCTVLDVEINDDQKRDAKSCGVTLITAQRKEGVEAKDDPMKLEWLFNHEIYYPDLGKLENIQYIVGYAPKTGIAATDIRRRLFPGAKLVLINHVSPENNCLQTEICGSIELEGKMLRMAKEADQIFSIGPTIHSYFQNAYRAEFQGKDLSEIPHEEILPQAMVRFRNKIPKFQVSKGPKRHNILTYGEPSAIEKCSVIAGSIGSVADQLPNTHLKWKLQGVSQDSSHTDLVDKMKSNQVLPTLHLGHSAGELLVSVQQSHLCIPTPVYMDYGFNGLEAAVFGLPTVLTCNSELAYYIETYFDIHKDNWVVSNHKEESLKQAILKHLVDPSKAFNKAKALKEALLESKVVPESYAKFASMLTMPVGEYGEEDGKIDTKAGKIKATDDKDDKPQLCDQSKSQALPEHGNIEVETGIEETNERDEKEGKAKSTYSETGNPEMKQNGTPRQDDLAVVVGVDDDSFHKTLKALDEQSKADVHQLGHIKEKQNAVEAARRDCQMKLTQISKEAIDNENSRQEIENTTKEKLGDVDINSFTADSLGILLRFVTLYNLYRLKQTCRSGSLAKAFEPLLITDEMREIAAEVGVAPLRLKVTYDQKKFREVELFFINRDGGGARPLKSYDDIIHEVIIEDCNWDVPDSYDHQPMVDTAVTDVEESTDSLTVSDIQVIDDHLIQVEKETRGIPEQLQEVQEEKNDVGAILPEQKQTLKRRHEKGLGDEHGCPKARKVCKENHGDGGGIEPLKSYDEILEEMCVDDDDSNCQADDNHEQDGNISMTADIKQSEVPSEMLLLEIDPKLEMKPSTETNVCTLLNPVKLTRQRGKQYDVLQMVIKMTDRVQHILTSRLEILALLGFVRYTLTDVAGEDGTQSFSELEEELFQHGKPILPITAADETLSLQARSLLPFQFSQESLKDSVIRYLAIEKSKVQSLHSQLSIKKSEFLAAKESLENQLDEALNEKSKFKTAKKILENQLDEALKEKSIFKTARESLEKQLDEALKEKSKFKTAKEILEHQLDETLQEKSQLEKRFKEQSEKDNKVIITQHPEYLILKDRLEKLEPNIADLQFKLDQKDKFISVLMTKLTKLSDAQSNVALRKIITGTLELGEKFITGEAQWKGETVLDILGKEETPKTQKTATVTTTPEKQGAASTETKKVEGDWSKLTLDGQGPYPGQKFNDPCGLTFHDDKLLVCDRLNNIVQILNQDYTCVKVLGSFSGQFAKPFQPLSVAVSQDNHYFILDDNNLQIVVCDQNSKVISIITLPARTDPYCIALLKGFVLVTDAKGHRLLKYTRTGQYVEEVGSLGLGKTQFHYPWFVAVNSMDVIMVSDCDNHCIKCFDSDFNFLYQYGEEGDGDSQLYGPRSIAIDGTDNVYVCDTVNARISMWSGDRMWRLHLFQDEVSLPLYIAVSRDRICVRGRDDEHITVFSK